MLESKAKKDSIERKWTKGLGPFGLNLLLLKLKTEN